MTYKVTFDPSKTLKSDAVVSNRTTHTIYYLCLIVNACIFGSIFILKYEMHDLGLDLSRSWNVKVDDCR
jgi:hypothetical protein